MDISGTAHFSLMGSVQVQTKKKDIMGINQSINQSVSQSISQSVSQSINQSVTYQSINQYLQKINTQ